ncbi:hypothetical protein ACH5RR_021395 [Cinchona calisaya]|uniref:C2H2-type domain-containing protein n=1 Tax=Cinchona calisaya TaxID=153742 RepID=A0ABD2ZH74_9GENT
MEGEKSHHELKTPLTTTSDGGLKLKVPKSTREIREAEVEAEAEAEAASPIKKSHVCHECNKGFSSGKALGGHLSSAHVQGRENLKKLKFNQSTKFKRDGSRSDAATKEIVCKICGKDFASMKSLFGHMRCHPEREYRGMEPRKERPAKIVRDLSPSLSNHDDDEEEEEEYLDTDNQANYYHVDENGNLANYYFDDFDAAADSATLTAMAGVVDLSESLSSWIVKGKRGREGVRKHVRKIQGEVDEERKLRDAVYQFISLVNGDSSLRPNNPKEEEHKSDSFFPRAEIREGLSVVASESKKKKERVQVEEVHPAAGDRRDFPAKKRKFSETATNFEETLDGELDIKGKGKALKFNHEKLSSNSKDFGLSRQYDNKNNSFSDQELNKRRRGQRKTPIHSENEREITKLDGVTELGTPQKFKCSTCGKTFPTHQALGGHRSSHNKLKVSIKNTADRTSSPFLVRDKKQATSFSQLLPTPGIGGSDNASTLVESIHPCKNYDRTFSSGQALGGHQRCHWQGQSSQVASPVTEENQTSHRIVLEIDLNQPAYVEDANISNVGNDHTGTGYAYSYRL